MTADTKQDFTCPWSGTTVAVSIPPHKSADEFCPTCDFPMFWAYDVERATLEAAAAAAEEQAKVPVVPEVVEPAADVTCAVCATANPAGASYCAQCGSPLGELEEARVDEGWTWKTVAVLLLIALAAAVALGILYWPF